jgi:hypothetical protein
LYKDSAELAKQGTFCQVDTTGDALCIQQALWQRNVPLFPALKQEIALN